ncbi:MAG: hypothetical protein ABR500_16550 [Dermatophilaceae bacterium]|nr:hypothetical protein [Intrasporangiaceae bacterium]
MRRSPVLRLASVVGLALALVGCGSSTETPDPAAPATPVTPVTSESLGTPEPTMTSLDDPKAMRVTMTGTIEDGVESGCLVFTDEATGKTYSVTEELPPEMSTDGRVSVTGTIDPDMMSFCMQGPVLIVDEVSEAAD